MILHWGSDAGVSRIESCVHEPRGRPCSELIVLDATLIGDASRLVREGLGERGGSI